MVIEFDLFGQEQSYYGLSDIDMPNDALRLRMIREPRQPAETSQRERPISERAYALWHEEGQPEGKDQEHWLRAEQDYDDYSESAPAPDRIPRSESSAPR